MSSHDATTSTQKTSNAVDKNEKSLEDNVQIDVCSVFDCHKLCISLNEICCIFLFVDDGSIKGWRSFG